MAQTKDVSNAQAALIVYLPFIVLVAPDCFPARTRSSLLRGYDRGDIWERITDWCSNPCRTAKLE